MKRFCTILVPSSKCRVLNRRRANFLWKFLFAGTCGGAPKCLPLGEGADRREADVGWGALSYCKACGDCSLSLIRPRFAGPPIPTLFVPSGHFPLIGGIGPQGKALGAVHHSTPFENPRVSEGPRPLCLGKSPEETLPKGFLWRLLSFAKRFLSCTSKKENA